MAKKFILDPRFGRVMRKIPWPLKPWEWCLIGSRAVEVWTSPPQTPEVHVLTLVGDAEAPELSRRFAARKVEPKGQVWEGSKHPRCF